VVAYGSGWDQYALSSPAVAPPRRRASPPPPGETRNLRRDAGRLESVGTCGLGLSRFVSAGVVLGTDLVAHLSATVRGYGELARFCPGSVVDPDTGCCLAGPRGADVD
jgi:hypothetical protein